MDFKELNDYLEKELDMIKFKNAVINQIEMANKEIPKVEDQIRENKYNIHIEKMWVRVVNDVYTKISGNLNKKTITLKEAWISKMEELDTIQSLNDSFNDV